jgi:hypothetical protein
VEGEGVVGEEVSEKVPESCEVSNKLFCARADFVPNGIELTPDDGIEGTEIGVFDVNVVKIELFAYERRYGETRWMTSGKT